MITLSDSQKRAVLITGATGYIGHHVAARLLEDGWLVHGLVRAAQSSLPEGAVAELYDGTLAGLKETLARVRPTAVMHLASAVVVEHESADVDLMIEANIRLPTLLMQAMLEVGCLNFINTGTSWQHYDALDLYLPANLYAATKQAFESIVSYYVSAANFSVITLKLYDTYGPNDRRRKIIPLLLNLIVSDGELAMSPGEQEIDLVYVDDVVAAYVLALTRVCSNTGTQETYSVRTGETISLKELVAVVEGVVGRTLSIRWGGRPYREREVMRTWPGPTLPGWAPKVALKAGIARVIEARFAG